MAPRPVTVFILLGLSVTVGVCQAVYVSALFKNPLGCAEEGHIFPGDVLRGLTARNRGQCMGECATEQGCLGVNVIEGPTNVVSCELLTNAPTSYSEMQEQEKGTFFAKTDQAGYQLTALHGYTCNCDGGYMGNNCDMDFDECASNPCMNGAGCVDAVNGYSCSCAPGYEGTHCETDINECESNPCMNGAGCVDAVNGYTCSCAAGYEGTQCETDTNECASNPCLNGAGCVDAVNGYTCTCVAGYAGTHCQANINECASNPCMNGATGCVDAVNGYTCSCAVGYEGTNCEIAGTIEVTWKTSGVTNLYTDGVLVLSETKPNLLNHSVISIGL